MLEESHVYFHKAADVLGLAPKLREILLSPFRVVKVEIVTEGDDGQLNRDYSPNERKSSETIA